MPTASAPPADHTPPAEPEQLRQWQEVALPHLSDIQFGPAELARLLALSERTLYRRLGELAGLTPAAWLRELRLDYARRLLEDGRFSTVSEVAHACGFATAKHFGTLYTERFGRKPSDYRT
ncbi:MAG: AraC family transcriptional regulator [Hymenobacter sp.]|nr:MAG: AraC family transcriptional regulator [Hymenobacter sp.]